MTKIKREIWGNWLKMGDFWGNMGHGGKKYAKLTKNLLLFYGWPIIIIHSVVKINGYQTEVKVLNNGINRISEQCVLEL